jgi:hypothetical protein
VDSDLIATGCPHTLLVPPPVNAEGLWLNFASGNWVYHYDLEKLRSCHDAEAELERLLGRPAKEQPKASKAEGLGLWLAASMARHGEWALQMFGAINNCDYGGVPGAGPQMAVEALHQCRLGDREGALDNISELNTATRATSARTSAFTAARSC